MPPHKLKGYPIKTAGVKGMQGKIKSHKECCDMGNIKYITQIIWLKSSVTHSLVVS
jgi:hypothetical protein